MYSKKEEEKASKTMSYVLRHSPEDIDLVLDSNGWADINELIDKINKSAKCPVIFTSDLIKQVVINNDKQRFALSEDGKSIRANQGHTIDVDLDLPFVEPPEYLFHGTAIQNIDLILSEGLKPMKRNDVHLSYNQTIARSVGMRYGKPVILEINTKQMYQDGCLFQCSRNNVWLTKKVDSKYIKILD